jgi:hypothetical protein
MGVRNICTKIYKARKDHNDDSAFLIVEALDYIRSCKRLTFTEMRAIAELKANVWKIKKGQLYEAQFNEMDGEIYTFKTLPAIAAICRKLRLYDEI